MKLLSVEQCSQPTLQATQFDVVIAASGYESRAPHIAKVCNISEARRIAFGFVDRQKLARKANDKAFKQLGFKVVPADGSSGEVVRQEVRNAISTLPGDHATVLIDYSSMTKIWYAAILRLFATARFPQKRIDLYFSYSCSEFSRPARSAPNQYMGPVPGFCNLDLPDRKTALIIGFGYEAERAAGLVEYVEPAETFGFYTDPALDRKFPKTVRKNNAQLLARLGKARTFRYPVSDLRTTAAILSSLCSGLIKDYRVILAPLGPKPFALLCFLLATQNDEFDVWRVSAGEQAPPKDRPPSGDIVTAQAAFVS